MWRFIAQQLDRIAIRSACGSVLPSPDGQSRLDEAAALLRQPDFFRPEVAAARLQFTGPDSFEFPSPIRTGSLANDLVRGLCRLPAHDWQRRPSVILLHGWNAELQYRYQFPSCSRLLAQRGVNAFRFELPYHASRRPAESGAIRNFFSGDMLHVVRATQQALADIRALALWLRAQGSPAVGLWGVSLGGWLGGMAAAHHPEIDFAALLTPVARMDRALEELPFCESIRNDLRGAAGAFHGLNLVSHPARLPRGRLLVVDAELDLFITRETVNELVVAHGAELWRVRHSHISVLFSRRLLRRIVRWLAETTAGQGENSSKHRVAS